MISNTKQDWSIGAVVKVGFLKLKVVSIKALKDYPLPLPDIYELESLCGTKKYEFIPHNGLSRIS